MGKGGRASRPSARPLVLLPALIAMAAVATTRAAGGQSFRTLDRGHHSGIDDALAEVYRTTSEFADFWTRHQSRSDPSASVPDVDFASSMVAAVFRGAKSSGGYGVEVTSVERDDGGKLVVNFLTEDPPPGAMLTMAITQPYHIVELDASDAEVSFAGSAKSDPEPVELPRYILTVDKAMDKAGIVSAIEGFPETKEVTVMKSLPILFVDFDSDKITKGDARKLLEGVTGVETIEEEYQTMGGMGMM